MYSQEVTVSLTQLLLSTSIYVESNPGPSVSAMPSYMNIGASKISNYKPIHTDKIGKLEVLGTYTNITYTNLDVPSTTHQHTIDNY